MAGAEVAVQAKLHVEVAYSPRARVVDIVALQLPAGATLRDAVDASGLVARHAIAAPQRVGVWGRLRKLDDAVHDGDRVEIHRPLVVDPKQARRLRQRRQRVQRADATCSRTR